MSATAPTRRAHVLIAAERLPTRVGLRLALEPEARCTEAADAQSAVDAAVRDRPDVCLLGFGPSGQGLRTVNEIATRVPSTTVILLTSELNEEEFMAAVRAGATGYLTQSLDPKRLPFVVRGALRGEPAVPRRFVSRLLDELKTRERRRSVVLAGKGRIALTAREWEVAEMLLRSASTSQIAEQLGVAPVTVRRHVGSVERKLGVATRAEVIALLSTDAGAAAPA
ncbi:MAG TPA: response regulator transcription factor [Acidothermaceae bacterium]|nr:response regulator transcription factor [Acidothermaceae bacterium]